ncbi:hypothetical protein FA09DRAFT_184491 [Tilletiopsis washingtonensis]|uniref:Uncharacterized protein n=1 Tax=Tilletiopsis washingtonensis TaxID=58919 RepID=A0A316ZJD5_9BASI|nr:hypothetical protein FA09DRAFT_184491 [Tilletiopsis washingtonensis]PWO00384.1 hypothetical protein FA09DRAFT_184491 [Tilletiopsis washingtonensis]
MRDEARRRVLLGEEVCLALKRGVSGCAVDTWPISSPKLAGVDARWTSRRRCPSVPTRRWSVSSQCRSPIRWSTLASHQRRCYQPDTHRSPHASQATPATSCAKEQAVARVSGPSWRAARRWRGCVAGRSALQWEAHPPSRRRSSAKAPRSWGLRSSCYAQAAASDCRCAAVASRRRSQRHLAASPR